MVVEPKIKTPAPRTTIVAADHPRRSSRIMLSVPILISGTQREDGSRFEAPGDTLVVNQHGALIRTDFGLAPGMNITVSVPCEGRSGRARVVWISPASKDKYGIELEAPYNLWGVEFPPQDW